MGEDRWVVMMFANGVDFVFTLWDFLFGIILYNGVGACLYDNHHSAINGE
jgi:hypothetical protein